VDSALPVVSVGQVVHASPQEKRFGDIGREEGRGRAEKPGTRAEGYWTRVRWKTRIRSKWRAATTAFKP
jgi:hypothetical protein